MWRAIMTLLVPLPLVLMVAGGVFYVDYQKHIVAQKAFGEAELSMPDFAKARLAGILKAREREQKIDEFDVGAAMPQAPEGWTRERYKAEHGTAITGSPYKKSVVVKDTEKSLQDDFLAVRKYQTDKMAFSYISGNKVLAVRIKVLPAKDRSTLEGKLAERMNDVSQILAAVEAKPENPVILTLGDAPVRLLPQFSRHYVSGNERPVAYQRFRGRIGGQLEILAFGNVGLSEVRQILGAIDHGMLARYADHIAPVSKTADAALTSVATSAATTPAVETSGETSQSAEVSSTPVPQAVQSSWISSLRAFASGPERAPERVTLTCSNTSAGFKRCVRD